MIRKFKGTDDLRGKKIVELGSGTGYTWSKIYELTIQISGVGITGLIMTANHID